MADLENTIKRIADWINAPFAMNAEIDPQIVHDALELLKSLKTENQIFSDNIKELTKQRDAFAMTIDELRHENKRLKNTVNRYEWEDGERKDGDGDV